MDATQFDKLTRLLVVSSERRAWLGAALGLWFVDFALVEEGDARRQRKRQVRQAKSDETRSDVTFARRKKRKKKCRPKCAGKACGPNGCKRKRAGVCGTCSPSTVCNDAGQCVGCRNDGECVAQVCNSASCQNGACVLSPVSSDPACTPPLRCVAGQCVGCGSASECAARVCNAAMCEGGTCTYSPVGNDPVCMPPQRCIDGTCIGCRSAGDCAVRICNSVSCQNETCVYTPDGNGGSCGGADDICCGGVCVNRASDEAHCGACDAACSGSDSCQSGVCCTVCASGCPYTSIHAALNAVTPGSTVRLCPGTYDVQRSFNKDVTLAGMGAMPGETMLSNAFGQIVQVSRGTIVTLRNLKVTGTTSNTGVGAIINEGDLTLQEVEVSGNTPNLTNNSFGGGISNASFDDSPRLTLIDSVVSHNAANRGGGIGNLGTLILTRSTVESNVANQGGGIINFGELTLNEGSRIRSNQSGGGVGSGAGVYNDGGTIALNGGSSIAGNTAAGNPDNCINVNGGTGCPA